MIEKAARAGLIFALVFAFDLSAQRVYTELKDAEQVKRFTEVSESLICQCGCNIVLSSCPHIECPWGIPARRLIEGRIRKGEDASAIIRKFENGFGDSISGEPIILELLQQGRQDLVFDLKRGYGPTIRARTPPYFAVALVGSALILAFLIFRFFWSRNRLQIRPTDSAELEKLLQSKSDQDWIDRLDR